VKISLVAVDLDGTLLTHAHAPASRGAALLTQIARMGVYVIIATTRMPDYVARLCRALGIDAPMICLNGAQVWGAPDGPVWVDRVIPRQVALEIARWADVHDCELSTTVGPMSYLRQRPGQPLGLFTPSVTVVPTNVDGIVGDPLRILVSQPEAIEGIRSLCQSKFRDRCYTEVYYEPDGSAHSLGVFAPGADKGTALALVCDRLDVAREHVLAIGDNVNDVGMFQRAAVAVAMGNVVEQVKWQASVVAPDNDEEGVAWALGKFVLAG
jgi:Cof subfamily protein (haloacid dehalogenase superfamily)